MTDATTSVMPPPAMPVPGSSLALPPTSSSAPALSSAGSATDPWPGFPRVLRGKTVRPDATTRPQELSPVGSKIGWIASPADTSLFICDAPDCHLLFPSAAKLAAHQATSHPPGVPRASITWFDPSEEKAAERRERELEEERLKEAARRSFMPL